VNSYQTSKGLSDADLQTIADLDHDGALTNADIQPMLRMLMTPGGGAAPEAPMASVAVAMPAPKVAMSLDANADVAPIATLDAAKPAIERIPIPSDSNPVEFVVADRQRFSRRVSLSSTMVDRVLAETDHENKSTAQKPISTVSSAGIKIPLVDALHPSRPQVKLFGGGVAAGRFGDEEFDLFGQVGAGDEVDDMAVPAD
jgi:hypothetical protein